MPLDQIAYASADHIATAAIRAKKVSAVEVAHATLDRIDPRNPHSTAS